MSEESDRVWESLSGELQKVRRRRLAVRMGAFAAVVSMGVFFMQRGIHPSGEHPAVVTEVPVETHLVEVVMQEPSQLAVLVYDGEGMRFELIDGEQLASREMEFSLQPVVMGSAEGYW